MLTTEKLSYWYTSAQQALFQDVDLEFDAGHSYAIVGRSGSGKTTMVSLLSGLDQPRAGKIKFNGEDIAGIGLANYRKKDVAIVFQAYNLLTYMSALDNLLSAMAISDSQHQGDRDYAKQMLAKLGLSQAQMTQNVQKLSGGQQQRVAIARTMVCDAPLVVADEPTGNLDEENTEAVIDLFQQIASELGKCVIIVTHEPDVANRCDAVIRLADKQFTWEKTISES